MRRTIDRSRRRALASLTAAAAASSLVFAACGGDDTPSSAPAPSATATATAMAAVTQTPTPDAGQLYTASALVLIDSVAEVSRRVSDVAQRADVQSEAWRAEFTAGLQALRELHMETQSLDPPPDLAEKHEVLLSATSALDEAAQALTDAVESLDGDALQRASESLAAATAALTEARVLLRSGA